MQPYSDSRMVVGQTQLDATDFVPPRVKVVQQMSVEAADGRAKPGDFFNTLIGENYGASLTFIPLFPFKQRIFLMRENRRERVEQALGQPLSDGDGLKCRSLDTYQGIGEPGVLCNECPLSKWNGGTPPLCSETYNVAAMNEWGDVIFLGFQKSSAKVGKRLFSALRLRREQPFARLWHLETRQERNDKGIFFVPDFAITKDTTPPELIGAAREWATRFAGMTIDVTPAEVDAVDDEDAASPANAPF